MQGRQVDIYVYFSLAVFELWGCGFELLAVVLVGSVSYGSGGQRSRHDKNNL